MKRSTNGWDHSGKELSPAISSAGMASSFGYCDDWDMVV